jgi:hypothetical protein
MGQAVKLTIEIKKKNLKCAIIISKSKIKN